jgi:arsenate reductase (thioredoxin)
LRGRQHFETPSKSASGRVAGGSVVLNRAAVRESSRELQGWRMRKKNVLFVCIHNSARSQMAEAFLRQVCGHEFEPHSAGLEPGQLNPLVVETMQELGIDISGNQTKAVFDFVKSGKVFAYVITVCDEASAERCPIFAGVTRRLHWSFPDPSAFEGTSGERLARTREVRDLIKEKINQWCGDVCSARAE